MGIFAYAPKKYIGLTHLSTKSIAISLQLSEIKILYMMFTALDVYL